MFGGKEIEKQVTSLRVGEEKRLTVSTFEQESSSWKCQSL
jgi:hypothetical protein